MVGFDFVKTRTLAYVQSYDWLPIIVQFSKICTNFHDLFRSVSSTGDLIILSSSAHSVKHFFKTFLEVFCLSFVLCPNDLYKYSINKIIVNMKTGHFYIFI